MIWEGDLVVEPGDRRDYSSIKRVNGSVVLRPTASLFAPKLTTIDGELHAQGSAHFDAPALIEVRDIVHISAGASVRVPVLRSVGGLDLQEGADVSAPALATIDGWLFVYAGATAELPALLAAQHWYRQKGGLVFGFGGQPIYTIEDLTQQRRRRYVARQTTVPHARCGRADCCVEHERDSRVEPCK